MIYLASQPERLLAFCAHHGLSEADLKARLADAEFHGFLLDVLLQDESELLAFTAELGLPPDSIRQARAKLPGFTP